MGILPHNKQFEVTSQVVIVGGGACGLTAALAATEQGAEVILLEQDHLCRGSSSMSLGAMCAAGTLEQQRHGVSDGAEQFHADIVSKTGGRADPVLARLVADASGSTLDWLNEVYDLGIVLDTAWRPAFGHSRARMHVTPGRTGQDLMDRLLASCSRAGVNIVNDAHVSAVYAEPGNRVTGVRFVRPDGGREDVGCGALVLATCGFGGNRRMIAEHIPGMRDARYFGWEGNQGDGIDWGVALGAGTGDMDAYQGLGLLAEPQGIDVNPRLLIEGGIQVDALGLRFSDELGDVSGQGARVISRPGGIAWVIYDQRIHDTCSGLPQYQALAQLGAIRTGATVAALAAVTGLPADALVTTFGKVESACRAGQPDDFGRRFSTPPLAPPYQALKVTGALFHTQGGLSVDHQARVVRPDGTPLPNLLAGGGAARSISGPGPSGYLPGAGLCMAITLGAVAGRTAALLQG